jgi:hypothetical protein
MPGLVKIGYSTKDPVLRAAELGNTGAPHAYEVAYDALVESPKSVEIAVHRDLAAKREGREWFRLTVQTAIDVIQKHAGQIYLQRALAVPGRELPEAVVERCHYTPDCKQAPSRKYHHMAFCEGHYKIYMAGRASARRRVGPGKGPV